MRTALSTEGVVVVRAVVLRCLELSCCSRPLHPDRDTHGDTGKALLPCHSQWSCCAWHLPAVLCCRDITAGRVLPLSAEPQMFQGLTPVPEYLHYVFLLHILITPSIAPRSCFGEGLVHGYPSPHQGDAQQLCSGLQVVLQPSAFILILQKGFPWQPCTMAQKPTWHWHGSFSPVCWSCR